MNILFMGTPDFSVPILETLIKNHNVSLVVCQPDKAKGRHMVLTPPPVKECALLNNIEVFQPQTLKDNSLMPYLEKYKPDVIVVAAYGKILPEYVLNYPKYGCINVHASILPKYRGAAPIQWSIINGDKQTGISIMYMDKGMDTGDIMFIDKTDILENETADALFERLSVISKSSILKALSLLESGNAPRIKQNEKEATYASMITKQTGKFSFDMKAKDILNLVNGVTSWPGAFFEYNGEIIKVFCPNISEKTDLKAGQVYKIDDNGIFITCSDGIAICFKELQRQGKKRMRAKDFVNGCKISVNDILK